MSLQTAGTPVSSPTQHVVRRRAGLVRSKTSNLSGKGLYCPHLVRRSMREPKRWQIPCE